MEFFIFSIFPGNDPFVNFETHTETDCFGDNIWFSHSVDAVAANSNFKVRLANIFTLHAVGRLGSQRTEFTTAFASSKELRAHFCGDEI